MSTNLRKKALFPIIAMVLVSVIALSSVTYAWFTMSNTATVENLNVQVTEAKGIQISLDAENWASQFSSADITSKAYGGHTNQMPTEKIFPVSTAGGVTDGKMAMFLGDLQTDNTLTITAETDGQNQNYIVFDLFFKMTADQIVTLDKGATASRVVDGGKGSADSARVAFIDLGTAQNVSDARLLNTAEKTVIWEPVSGSTYNGIKAAGTGVATVNGFVEAGDYATAVETVTDEAITLDLKEGINKVRIYIWMEGQDVNCINDASGGSFATYLKFSQPEDANA